MNARADQFKRDRLVKHETGGLARFTIQTRLYAAAVAYVLSMATIAGLAYVGRERAQSGLASMHEAITAQRNGGDMDMMHDAIRADVLAALSGDASQISESRANLAEHVRRMDDAAAAVKEHSTDDSVLKALDDVRAPVAAYQAEAGRVVDLSSSDMDAAKAEMPAFLEKFGALEDSLGDLNTEIEKASVAHQQAAGDEVDGVVTLVTIFCAFAGVVGGAISVVLVNGIVRSLSRTLETLHEFARGDCTVQAPTIGNDEVAAMTRALNESIGNTGAAIRSVSDGANSLSVSAGALSRTAEGMSGEVGSMGHQLQSTSTGADQVSANVQAVSAGMDAMSAAMHEIARNAVQAAKVAAQAVQASEGTSAAVGRLGESGNEIGQFVKVISTIAHQTNLLALNATIEAARAGEAGRGFAVVANEVKELARETAKATDDIARKIEAIQADTRMAVESNNEITQVIGQINDLQTAIAGAVEEQSVTTKEIARNLQEAAQGSASVASGVSEMARSAGATSSGAAEFEASTQRLARLAVELESTCARFHT